MSNIFFKPIIAHLLKGNFFGTPCISSTKAAWFIINMKSRKVFKAVSNAHMVGCVDCKVQYSGTFYRIASIFTQCWDHVLLSSIPAEKTQVGPAASLASQHFL